MSNTNVPPGGERRNELLEMQNRLTQDLNRSLVRLRSQFEGFVNPVDRLTTSIRQVDKTNIEALKLGTTYQKLTNSVNKNSTLLTKNLTSQRELTAAVIDGFGQGVRNQTQALSELTTEMVATGQNVQALNQLNSNLVLFTGNNVQSIDNLAKVNKEVSDAYGVTNDKLINTLNSLKETMQQASFFGTNAVESLGTVATELTGRAGGTNITGALATLNRLLTGGLETERIGALLGATSARETLARGGRINLQDVLPILDQLQARREALGGGRFGLDILADTLGISKMQTTELLNLAEIARKDFKVQDELKKTADETYNTIENVNKRAVNFYDNTAMGMLGALGSLNTNLIFFMQQVGMGGGAIAGIAGRRRRAITPGSRDFIGPVAPSPGGIRGLGDRIRGEYMGLGSSNNVRMRQVLKRGIGGAGLAMAANPALQGLNEATGGYAGGAVQGATLGASIGSFIPGIGTLAGGGIGLVVGGLSDIYRAVSKSSKAEEEQLKMMKEEKREKRAREASQDVAVMGFLTSYVRSRMGTDPNATSEMYLEQIAKNQRALLAKTTSSRTSIKK